MPKIVEQDSVVESKSAQAIKKSEFKTLLAKCKSAQSTMDEERASMGGLIADAVENKNLHKKAFGIARRIDKMDPLARAELLFHFDIYREFLKWEKSDLLADRGDVGEPKAPQPSESDEDVRPRNLRTGGIAPTEH